MEDGVERERKSCNDRLSHVIAGGGWRMKRGGQVDDTVTISYCDSLVTGGGLIGRRSFFPIDNSAGSGTPARPPDE